MTSNQAQPGDKVVIILPSGMTSTGTVSSRNADGTVNLTTETAEVCKAEAIVVYCLIQP